MEQTNPGAWLLLGKCSFCDISLDYIDRYEPIAATQLCDRIEAIVAQTGETGFHFVDEAAPPALMAELALELILGASPLPGGPIFVLKKFYT